VRVPDGTPVANAMLSVIHSLGLEDVDKFGDSTGTVDLVNASATTTAAR
jgi:hypothetical protein